MNAPDAPVASVRTMRRRIYRMLEPGAEHGPIDRVVHWVLVGLVLASVLVAVMESVPALRERYGAFFQAVDVIAVAVFTLEVGLRIWTAAEHAPWAGIGPWRARMRWLVQPLSVVDLVAIAPFYAALFGLTDDFGALLVLRLFRFFKLARYSPGMATLVQAVHTERRGLLASAVILAGTALIAASFMHYVEGEAQPDKFGTIPDALYWAAITLTTVGYGDVVPTTPFGKLISSLTAVAGILMLALPVGILASAFAREIQKRDFVVTWSMLARVPLFARLDASELDEIMHRLEARYCDADDVIVRRGEDADGMFFIASGQVEIELPQGHVVLGPGDFFGEMAVLSRTDRTATAKALTRCKLLVLDAYDLHMLMDHSPAMAEHIHAVAEARAQPPAAGGGVAVSGAREA